MAEGHMKFTLSVCLCVFLGMCVCSFVFFCMCSRIVFGQQLRLSWCDLKIIFAQMIIMTKQRVAGKNHVAWSSPQSALKFCPKISLKHVGVWPILLS